jgi:hypothetical protein
MEQNKKRKTYINVLNEATSFVVNGAFMTMRVVVVAATVPCMPAKGGVGVRCRPSSCTVCSVLYCGSNSNIARDCVAQVLTPLAHSEQFFYLLSQITLVQKHKHFLQPQQHVTGT